MVEVRGHGLGVEGGLVCARRCAYILSFILKGDPWDSPKIIRFVCKLALVYLY